MFRVLKKNPSACKIKKQNFSTEGAGYMSLSNPHLSPKKVLLLRGLSAVCNNQSPSPASKKTNMFDNWSKRRNQL